MAGCAHLLPDSSGALQSETYQWILPSNQIEPPEAIPLAAACRKIVERVIAGQPLQRPVSYEVKSDQVHGRHVTKISDQEGSFHIETQLATYILAPG